MNLEEYKKMAMGKKQIYIVDDDASVCRALKFLLMTFGFAVNTFPCSEEYFSVVSNSSKGCLILDIRMPGLDGWQTLKRIIKSGSKRPVILMSADKSGGLKEEALKAGAMGFLQKPFNDQMLVGLIKTAFEKKYE